MSKKNNLFQVFKSQAIDNNPTFIQVLGMCPTLAVTTSVFNGLGMGLAATCVLICSNLFISLLRKFIPKQVRIAAYVIVIAGFVTVIDLFIKAFLPDLSKSLGLFIPLIVVNCIILARAEAFASKNTPVASMFDGLGAGLGFTGALCIISAIREIIGAGCLFGVRLFPESFEPALMFILPAGGFLTLGFLIAFVQYLMSKKKGEDK